jgi:hypothetical protein
VFGFVGLFESVEHCADLWGVLLVCVHVIGAGGAGDLGGKDTYLSFGRDMRTHARMAVMRDPAEIAVLDACDFEGTCTEDVLGFADRAFDVIVGR